MAQTNWYVWITCLTDCYVETLVGRLVSHGWTVAPISKNLTLEDNGSLVILALHLKKDPGVAKEDLVKELRETMKLLEMGWVSMVITTPADCMWSIEALPDTTPPRPHAEALH